MDEKLIDMVRQYPELYDLSHRCYSDNFRKKNVWEEIGKALNKRALECKQRWLNLRGQFRKARQKQMTATGQTYRKWKFEENMSFLLCYMKDKDRLSSADAEEGDEDNQPEEEEQEDQATAFPPIESDLKPPPTSNHSSAHTPSPTPASKKFTRSRNHPQTASATFMKYILKNREQKNDKLSEKGALELFFQSMLKTVKTFSPLDQHIFRNQMFRLVSDMEAKYLMPHPPINNISHRSSSSSPSAYHDN